MEVSNPFVNNFVGGKFFAFRKNHLNKFLQIAEFYLYLYNEYKLTEEVLNTALLVKLGWSFDTSDGFIERIWTDKETFCNLTSVDLRVPFLHMPAEKQMGFYTFYHDILMSGRSKEITWPIPWDQMAHRFRLEEVDIAD